MLEYVIFRAVILLYGLIDDGDSQISIIRVLQLLLQTFF